MRTLPHLICTFCAASAVALLLGAHPFAQARPSNATAECNDGTFSTASSRQGACADHGGIKTWFADETRTAAKGAKSNTKKAAKSTKDAAKDAGKAAAGVGKTVGEAAKDVGKATGEAAKDTAKTTKRDSKSVATAGKDAGKTTAAAVKPRPSDAPTDATARCKDGTYSHAATRRGACSDHRGVSEWYGR